MTRMFPALLATLSLGVAEMIEFDFKEGGLKPPESSALTGAGGEIESGLWFDTVKRELTVVVGYGSSAGFADLTGAATAIHIHGPKPTDATPPVMNPDAVLFDLWSQHFLSTTPAQGGIVRGVILYPEGQTNDLFAGTHYLNIHTAQNPAGEIRGTLRPKMNEAPVVVCPENVTTECKSKAGTEVGLTITVSDLEGEALRVVWAVDGVEVQTNEVLATSSATPTEVEFTSDYLLGDHAVEVTVSDGKNTTTCELEVSVVDTTAPKFRRLVADPNLLWPPNHKMVPVKIKADIADCSQTTWKITGVTSNEAINDKGDGNGEPDWEILGDHQLSLRAERSGKGRGRVYTIGVEATDAGGLKTSARVQVKVPFSSATAWR